MIISTGLAQSELLRTRLQKLVLLVWAAAFVVLPAWGQKPVTKVTEQRQDQRPARVLTSPFPDSVGGWTKQGQPRSFDAANLWRYIDGDAEKYLKAGIESASTSDYKFQRKVDAVVDVYRMKDADGARKLFDSEPARNARPVKLGERGRLYRQSLWFLSGRYLVRIVAYNDLPQSYQRLMALGRGVQQRLPK